MTRSRDVFIRGFKLYLFVLSAGIPALTQANLLLNDSFDYTNGALVVVSDGKWTTHSGSANELLVASERLQLSGNNSEDVNARLAGQPYNFENSTNRFYASFQIRFHTLPGANGTYFAHFKSSSATTFAGRLWAFTSEAAPGKFRLGISSTKGDAVSATYPMDLELDTDYRVVTRLVNSNSTSKLWIDPIAESDFSVSTQEAAEPFTVVAYAFREASGEGELSIDDLRVGTSFGDVVPNAPPQQSPTIRVAPRNQSTIENGSAAFSVEVQAEPAPIFQWRFNGTNLPGATNATLILTNVGFTQSGFYNVSISNALDVVETEPVVLNVFSSAAPAFSLLTYNLHGNGVLNWTTNSAHVRAIGRQVQFLDPDILTLQEIPVTNNGTAQMENFVAAYRPGFYLATNSTDDLYIRSVIISRFPIVASRSWLHAADLAPFGYSGSGFTRDLFEAEIAVPSFPQPLHVFTVHLKSGQDSDSATKRAAEAGAISNFFVAGFLLTNSLHPYILTGDMNEDLARPPASNPQSIQRLLGAPVGFQLATPFNPINASELTFSIQSGNGLSKRYDYILPCGLLSSNAVSSEVFQSDLLDPLPPDLFSNDSKTASDHLPVLMVFGNPYSRPFELVLSNSNGGVALSWSAVPGQTYCVEQSSDLITWTPWLTNLLATNLNMLLPDFVIGNSNQFFRIRREL
ncbi:MAG TPA: endonuclease/exonuclease/phosphatase family protein [Verrucomicrobiae bacterium]|nr:endonuclease/exonuclease/phosphatase family protein [Verrucomicrobiae bacterium]